MNFRPTSLINNVFSNVGGYVISVVIAFFLTPVMIHSLGDGRYGAWSLVSELIGYYGLLDLGIRGAVTYYVAWHAARDQFEDIKEITSSAFWALSALGLIAIIIGIVLTSIFPMVFRTDGINLVEIRYALLIMTGVIGCSLPMNAFVAGLVAKRRFDITTGAEIGTRALSAIATYVALKAGDGLVAIALIQAGSRLIYWALTLHASHRVLGGIFARPVWFKIEKFRVLMSYGVRNAISQVALLIIYRMDLTVVGMFVGVGAVTFYSIGGTLITYATTLCTTYYKGFYAQIHPFSFAGGK